MLLPTRHAAGSDGIELGLGSTWPHFSWVFTVGCGRLDGAGHDRFLRNNGSNQRQPMSPHCLCFGSLRGGASDGRDGARLVAPPVSPSLGWADGRSHGPIRPEPSPNHSPEWARSRAEMRPPVRASRVGEPRTGSWRGRGSTRGGATQPDFLTFCPHVFLPCGGSFSLLPQSRFPGPTLAEPATPWMMPETRHPSPLASLLSHLRCVLLPCSSWRWVRRKRQAWIATGWRKGLAPAVHLPRSSRLTRTDKLRRMQGSTAPSLSTRATTLTFRVCIHVSGIPTSTNATPT